MKLVLVTGGFDPVHSGHLEYFRHARILGDQLIVGLNSDAWLIRKKGQAFMPLSERRQIVDSLKDVTATIVYNDDDNSSCNAITDLLTHCSATDEIIFANGGDRTKENIPEMRITDPRVKFVFGVGGEHKQNSSSWILREWRAPVTHRTWGEYSVVHEHSPNVKVKELKVAPGAKLSMQRHCHRSEFWFVAQGQAVVYTQNNRRTLNTYETYHVPVGDWHRLANETTETLSVIEIQYGERCEEQDIIRQDPV